MYFSISTSHPRGRRLDQGKHRVHRLCWIPRRLKSVHGPRDHASLTNPSTAVRPALLQEGCERFLHVRPAPLHARAIPVPRLEEGTITAQSIVREGPSATRQCGGPAPCQQGRAHWLSGVS